jgi:hypothetical protein
MLVVSLYTFTSAATGQVLSIKASTLYIRHLAALHSLAWGRRWVTRAVMYLHKDCTATSSVEEPGGYKYRCVCAWCRLIVICTAISSVEERIYMQDGST